MPVNKPKIILKPVKIWTSTILGAILIALPALADYGPPKPQTSVPSGGTQARFMCESVGKQYTVMYHPIDRPNDRYAWAVPTAMGTKWTPFRRCTDIASRLEQYRRLGLKELRTDKRNNLDIVCVNTEKDNECRIVFTVPRGRDPIATRDAVFRNLTMADNGQQTSGVNTFAEGNNSFGNIFGGTRNQPNIPQSSIDLRPFLSLQDGGTATQLRPRTVTNPIENNTFKLNPDRFR